MEDKTAVDPDTVLLTDDAKELCSDLCRYVMETRKEIGEKYPPRTLLQLHQNQMIHNDSLSYVTKFHNFRVYMYMYVLQLDVPTL